MLHSKKILCIHWLIQGCRLKVEVQNIVCRGLKCFGWGTRKEHKLCKLGLLSESVGYGGACRSSASPDGPSKASLPSEQALEADFFLMAREAPSRFHSELWHPPRQSPWLQSSFEWSCSDCVSLFLQRERGQIQLLQGRCGR